MRKKSNKSAPSTRKRPSSKSSSVFGIHRLDARRIGEIVPTKSIDVTITSPPYFDLKDYGSKRQIGFGQTYKEYLRDLGGVFSSVFACTKDSGSLWVIIDSYRRKGEVVPLPFDFSNEISKHGWKLQDIIIWGKDRTVPWSHKGQMRSLFEFILVFSKKADFVFNIDRVRAHDALKKWWIRYPERYNPNGKSPDAIWHFDIPVQGSWGNGFIRHFCPLPEAMIGQILEITTDEDDVVLDPFAGSGAVLSKASAMKRRFIGLELNGKYIQMFKRHLKETGKDKRAEYEEVQQTNMGRDDFYRSIVNLRALKFAKVLANKVREKRRAKISKLYVEISKREPKRNNAIVSVDYYFLVPSVGAVTRLQKFIEKASSIPPLSKFGIDYDFVIESDPNRFLRHIGGKRVYTYSAKVTHKYAEQTDKERAIAAENPNLIVSKIRAKFVEEVVASDA